MSLVWKQVYFSLNITTNSYFELFWGLVTKLNTSLTVLLLSDVWCAKPSSARRWLSWLIKFICSWPWKDKPVSGLNSGQGSKRSFYEHHYTWFILEQILSRSVRIFLLSVISRYEKSDKSIVWWLQSNRSSSKVISVLIWIYIFWPKWQSPRIFRTIIRFHIFKSLCLVSLYISHTIGINKPNQMFQICLWCIHILVNEIEPVGDHQDLLKEIKILQR